MGYLSHCCLLPISWWALTCTSAKPIPPEWCQHPWHFLLLVLCRTSILLQCGLLHLPSLFIMHLQRCFLWTVHAPGNLPLHPSSCITVYMYIQSSGSVMDACYVLTFFFLPAPTILKWFNLPVIQCVHCTDNTTKVNRLLTYNLWLPSGHLCNHTYPSNLPHYWDLSFTYSDRTYQQWAEGTEWTAAFPSASGLCIAFLLPRVPKRDGSESSSCA